MKSRNSTSQRAWRTGPLLPELPQTSSLAVYDLRAASPDIRLSVATLVGLVNRGAARVYLLENDDDEFWLGELDPSLPRTEIQRVDGDLLAHLLKIYREQIEGLVIYDPGLPDTINVATTLAALRSGLVVSPAQVGALRAEPFCLPVLTDLRTHHWKTPLQVYAWAYTHLLSECSHVCVAGLDPGVRCRLRPFLVAHRIFTCWLDARKVLPHPFQNWLSERSLLKYILSYFPPGAVHLGWFVNEPFGIRLVSPAGLLTFASDYCTNLEIWSNLHVRELSSQAMQVMNESAGSHVPFRRVFAAGAESEKKTTYLSFTISDGDNLQYCQHYLLRLWRDPARGSLPLGWTISPALQQTMPEVAEFYRRTATAHDEFIAGPSGAAYMLPSRWPRAYRQHFLQLTAASMQSMQLNVLQVLDSGTWFSMRFLNPSLQELFVTALAPHGLSGIFSGAGSLFPSWRNRADGLVYQNLGVALNARRALHLIKWAAARGTRYINIYIFAWSITPSDLQAIVRQLGADFEVVTPGQLLVLLKQREA